MTPSRENKAVVFADVSESSRLYQQLGDAAARNVVSACLTALAALLPRYEGELIKTLGDAILCVFPSADLALIAAGEMQALVSATKFADYPVRIHVGLHYGPVLTEKGDVFGDTVNVSAYLAAAATREQILTTEATEAALSAALKSCVRPIFHAVLKGSVNESIVYQVLWKTDSVEITDINLQARKTIPGDTGSLVASLNGSRIRIDQWHPQIVIGRAPECDLVVAERYASRQHLSIKLVQMRFYLFDHSINGTYVTLEGADEIHVLRGEMLLERSGKICVGRSGSEKPDEVISVDYDRRSLYRI